MGWYTFHLLQDKAIRTPRDGCQIKGCDLLKCLWGYLQGIDAQSGDRRLCVTLYEGSVFTPQLVLHTLQESWWETDSAHLPLPYYCITDLQGFIQHGEAFLELLFGDDQWRDNQQRVPVSVTVNAMV